MAKEKVTRKVVGNHGREGLRRELRSKNCLQLAQLGLQARCIGHCENFDNWVKKYQNDTKFSCRIQIVERTVCFEKLVLMVGVSENC